MSENESGTSAERTAKPALGPGELVYWGGFVGLAGALGALFVVSVHYGETLGLAPGRCVVVGCAMTVMLSQPVGLAGLAAGIGCGALVGAVYGFVRRRRRRPS